MATTPNDPWGSTEGTAPEPAAEPQTKFDEIGRRAGAALRRPAPDAGLADIARRTHQRRVATVLTSSAVLALVVAAVAILRDHGSGSGPIRPAATTVTSVDRRDLERTTVPVTPEETAPPASPVAPATFTPTAVARPMVDFGPVQTVGFSPDGSRIIARLGGSVSLIDASDGAELGFYRYATFDSPFDSRISTNENQILISSDGRLLFDGTQLWDIMTGSPAFDIAARAGSLGTFSADGSTFALGPPLENRFDTPNTVRLFDTATGTERTIDRPSGSIGAVLSDDGTRLVSFGLDGPPLRYPMTVWDVASGEELFHSDNRQIGHFVPRFAADGDSLILSKGDSGAEVIDLATGASIESFAIGGDFSDDWSKVMGSVVLGDPQTAAPGSPTNFEVRDSRTGTLLLSVPTPGGEIDGYWQRATITRSAFSPDGTRIVLPAPNFGASAIVWDLTTGQPIATLEGHTDQVVSAAFSPDGTTIVTASVDGTVRLWPAP